MIDPYSGFENMFFIVFFLVLGIIVFSMIKSIGQWNKNNHSPRLTVEANVVAKRTHVSSDYMNNTHSHFSTVYYVTFQVESGDRIELKVDDREYGMLVEGDFGRLTFQGTRYISFQRQYK